MIFPLTDYQEDGKRRWAFCQRQRWPGEKGQEEAVVSTLQNQGWMHDGISNDGLLYKTIAVLGLVHGKIYQLLCKLVPKNNQFRLANCPPKHNKIHSSTLNHSKAGWLWEVALHVDEMPICCRVRILFISEFEDPITENIQVFNGLPKFQYDLDPTSPSYGYK